MSLTEWFAKRSPEKTVLRSRNPQTRLVALNSVSPYTNRKVIESVAQHDEDPALRERACAMLGDCDGPSDQVLATIWIEDEDTRVREAARANVSSRWALVDACKTHGGHVLDGCVCTRCGLECVFSSEEVNHDWDGCVCRKCGYTREADQPGHDWGGCTCKRCGRWRDEAHSIREDCCCEKCGRVFHDPDENCVCTRCGEKSHDWGEWSDTNPSIVTRSRGCRTCGEHDWYWTD